METERRRRIADITAGGLAILVLALGALVVVKPAIDSWDELYRGDAFPFANTTQVVTARQTPEQAKRQGQTTVTRREAAPSGLERTLGKGGLLLLRVALVAIAAFLVAAVGHRALLGNYSLRAARREAADASVAGSPSRRAARAAEPAGAVPAPAHNGNAAVEEPTEPEAASAIGKIVSSRRESLGLSQRELAKRAGISHTVISRIESGQHVPGAKIVDRLAEALR